MIILDTNILSELVRPHPDERMMAWSAGFTNEDFSLTAITVGELLYGLNLLPDGKRKQTLVHLITRELAPFADRILPFDAAAATHYARIKTARRESGRPISEQDAMIAAIARSHGAAVATRNIKDFEGTNVTVINPWDHQPCPPSTATGKQ